MACACVVVWCGVVWQGVTGVENIALPNNKVGVAYVSFSSAEVSCRPVL